MNEQTITVLLQQILEQVEQLGALTEINQRRYATADAALSNGAPRGDEYQRHSLLQQQPAWQQQHLRDQMKRLRQRIHQLELLQRITEYTDVQVDVANVLEVGLDVVWEKAPLRFAVFILGEAELGPYTYKNLRGVPDAWRFVGKSCPFPLWGVLARALLPRLDPDEPDYLIIRDIQSAKRPRPEEFPWMPLDGSLMILPLRTQDRVLPTRSQERVVGAILLGTESTSGFDDPELCQDFYAIAHTLARILQIAQLRYELDERANQLVSLHLFTRSLTAIHSFDTLIETLINGINETFGRVDVLVYLNDRLWAKEASSYSELPAYVRSIIDWTMQAGQPIVYNPDDNAESLERFYIPVAAQAERQPPAINDTPVVSTNDNTTVATESPRLLVELNSPPLAAAYLTEVTAAAVNGKLDANAPAAQAYINQLRAQQALFVNNMKAALVDANVATFRNEVGATEVATYQIVFNGLSVDPGATPQADALRMLAKLPGVKNVYLDMPHYTQLYTSTTLINAPAIWSAVGGRANGGAGIKLASMDGGVHNQAAMMNGAGYSYPLGFGPNGLGLTANNNGKIIVSRAYFRPWDPPASGDGNPWPGVNGTSHGMHTASTAAGGIVTATYNGFNVGTISGVAPGAYVMSYRVFYASVNGNDSFYTTEGIAALEDIVQDGADVVNNSWGGGPGSIGGELDPLDQALINAVKAGVFVAMSNGNAGPGIGTSDHPSPHYINVAASTTGGTLAAGLVGVPNEANLRSIAFQPAAFGQPLPARQSQDFPYIPTSAVNLANVEGCAAWPANTFTGKAVIIPPHSCEFGVKVLNAEKAGAAFVVIHNNATGGDALIKMEPGSVGNQVTISSLFIGYASAQALVDLYTTKGAAAAILRVDTNTAQVGSQPDRIIEFSSRGPGVGGTLKPDIAAPGVNIIAQGYTEGASGEARHLGYGQVSGTSMASPHIAGAAALLQQRHPTWSVAAIKSAMMSTAKYLNVYQVDGVTPAQPLDMGAGRLDLAKAVDPGVILDPPSLSFGFVPTGTQKTITMTVTSVAAATETYTLSTLYTGAGFAPTQTKPITAITLNLPVITLNPGESKQVAVTFTAATSQGIGDNQGFVILDGPTHDAHLPAWARVLPALPAADVLVIDGDFSTLGPRYPQYGVFFNYRWYYTSALEQLGYTYHVLDYDTIDALPDAAALSAYRAIIYFTGDNYLFGAGLTELDMDKLVEYLNAGGTVIVMGQDMAATIGHDETDPANPHFFYQSRLGANWIQDSLSGKVTPEALIRPTNSAPDFLAAAVVDLTQAHQLGAAGSLTGAQETPPVNSAARGSFTLFHDLTANYTEFSVTITPSATQPITLTGLHIHAGATGVSGGVVRDLAALGGVTTPTLITTTLRITGVISPSLTVNEVQQLRDKGLYINLHTTTNPNGELRGQIQPVILDNQAYMDELDNRYHDGAQSPTGDDNLTSIPLLYYQGPNTRYDGTVAMGHRLQPSLEKPGVTYAGRSVYATFGLEGLRNGVQAGAALTNTSRSALLDAFLDWSWAPAPTTVQLTHTVAVNRSIHQFSAQAAYGAQPRRTPSLTPKAVQYRWDFGDGRAYITTAVAQISYQYLCRTDNNHTVRVEITDTYGNAIIGSQAIDVSQNCAAQIPASYLPLVRK